MKPIARYKALSMLENEHVPLLRRRTPYWRPRPAACWRDVHLPEFNWVHPEYTPDLPVPLTFLDANACYVSAASSAQFAHGELEHTGAMADPSKRPGAYRINWHAWQDPRIVSPLGSGEPDNDLVWIAQPTLEVLAKLEAEGRWPALRIHDSWTCGDTVRFRAWATAVNNDRAAALMDVKACEEHDREEDPGKCPCDPCVRYEEVKNGYSVAVQMMRGPAAKGAEVKSGVKRPDWYDTIHAQAAANTWRTTYRVLDQHGFEPVMMGSKDEVAWATPHYQFLLANGPLKIDNSGVAMGHYKAKSETHPAEVSA